MKRYQKTLLMAFKIGIGSSIAIYLAQWLQLNYAVSAGTITLLTLMTSKWETIKLSFYRLATFAMTILIGWVLFSCTPNLWIAYGLLLTVIVFGGEMLGWRSTISVNAVVAAHLVTDQRFDLAAVRNEFFLVLIGLLIAIILNLFHANHSHKKQIVSNMRCTEQKLQMILGELAAYLSNKDMQRNVWDDICTLEAEIPEFTREAYEYQNNTFHSHPEYYISYFEMRQEQCHILHNLHYEMKKIRSMPRQAKVIAEYLLYLTDYVVEINSPEEQILRLEQIFADMKKEDLPVTREEFESRAMLYHILMDIEDFLLCKKRFVNNLSEKQLQEYWKKDTHIESH